MGLFIGGSAITICELLDLVILNSFLKCVKNRRKNTKVSDSTNLVKSDSISPDTQATTPSDVETRVSLV